METLSSLYQAHLSKLQQQTQTILERCQLDAILIHSGELERLFLDDNTYPFKVNPHFKSWIPVTTVPNCWLWVDGVNPPKVWFYAPVDYWHSVEPLPNAFWTKYVDLVGLSDAKQIDQLLPSARQRVAYIGSATEKARALGIPAEHINPESLLNYFHYHRSYKSEYELYCMREAQKLAVSGHIAARDAFLADMSEFDINLAYLMATGQRDVDVPYSNIVALNEHAAVLHYTHLNMQPPTALRSFLLDAGAQFHGYAADITRTYAYDAKSEFAELIADLDHEQQSLIATIQAGVRYTDYHLQMHHRLASVLKKHRFITGLSVEGIVEQKLTTPFFPHGLGHPLGLQVHDVAGFMQDDQGTHLAAPEDHPYLRCTRILEPGMVLTIEPGLYFIDSLLDSLRQRTVNQHINWQRIDAFKPYGGIRIEDNIVIRDKKIENLTRDLHLV